MTKKDFCAITFPSTHLALRWEDLAKKENLEIKIIPVPRQISSSCGLAGHFPCEDLGEIIELCKKNKLDFEHVYSFSPNKKENPIVLK